jgi:hypothetical protein
VVEVDRAALTPVFEGENDSDVGTGTWSLHSTGPVRGDHVRPFVPSCLRAFVLARPPRGHLPHQLGPTARPPALRDVDATVTVERR